MVKTSGLLARHRKDLSHSLGEVVAVHSPLKSGARAPVTPATPPHCQRLSHVSCAGEVRFALSQRTAFCIRQVRRLAENQELVEGIYTQANDQFQTNGQPHAAEIVHRLVEREASGITQGAVRAPELVLNNIPGVAQQHPPRFLLSLDDRAEPLEQLLAQFLLRPTERRLVRDLEEVPDHLAALAVQPAIGQPHLLQSREHLPDLLRQHEPGQMNQYRRTQSRSRVRRARRQESELVVKRERNSAA